MALRHKIPKDADQMVIIKKHRPVDSDLKQVPNLLCGAKMQEKDPPT